MISLRLHWPDGDVSEARFPHIPGPGQLVVIYLDGELRHVFRVVVMTRDTAACRWVRDELERLPAASPRDPFPSKPVA